MAIHHANQARLPVLIVEAGQPSSVKLSEDAKSCAE